MRYCPLWFALLLCVSACDSVKPAGHTPTPPAPKCGDNVCNGAETCLSCEQDCGACPKCAAAPSCTDAVGVPAMPTPRDDLDHGVDHPTPDMAGSDMGPAMSTPPPSYTADCSAPQLRVRLKSLTATKHGGVLYCLVTASDGLREEVVLSQKTKQLNDGDTNYFDPTLTTFWGGKELQSTSNNLTLTYGCYEVGSDAWSSALNALSGAAGSASSSGPYGWAFGIASAGAAAAAAAAKATEGDTQRLSDQQTIDHAQLLDLTNGRTWQIRQKGSCGSLGLCQYDWTLILETWGCAATKMAPPS
jgi:hypothetical protein